MYRSGPDKKKPRLYPFGRNTIRCRFEIRANSDYNVRQLSGIFKIKVNFLSYKESLNCKTLPTNYLSGSDHNAKEATFNSGRRGITDTLILNFFSHSKEILQSGQI